MKHMLKISAFYLIGNPKSVTCGHPYLRKLFPFLLKQAFSEKQNLKTSNISHSKRKTFEKDSNTALTTRQCHIRFGNGQTIGNLGVYHRFRSLEYRSRKSGTKTQSYCQSRRTWLEITFGTSKILTHWPKNLNKKKIFLLFYFFGIE